MRLVKQFALIGVLLSLAACGKAVPPEKSAYVGSWQAPTMRLAIAQEGRVVYWRHEGGVDKSVDAPLKGFKGNDFVVGVGPASSTFVVSVAPHQDNGVWKMTVDGVELTKQP